MKIRYFLSLFLFYATYKHTTNIVKCDAYSDLAATTALSTIIRDPLSMSLKDLYDHGVKIPITDMINILKKAVRYKKILRWSRMWWILLVREIVGNNKVEEATECILRDIWDQCTISIYNNTLYSVESKPILFLHGILNECKNSFSTKLRHDPGLIVSKIDQILKSQIYRFWVSEPYLKIGRSNIFYANITQKNVPLLPKECTLKHLSSYMEEKLKSMESKKNIESGKYEFDVDSKNDSNDAYTEYEDDQTDEILNDQLFEEQETDSNEA
ncbi:exported protein 2 [Plasmodium berghei]|uniref:Exported protein 2 n=2 Tax=Plasmodium berghei TaxID=5821 RepID=A0A509AQ65_PLABA|nr:exported protein 2 [Plasmodium berghei ANKA]CXI97067.1 exported protein 2 [Plasmodium berghei]SCL97464.1 exported protein 2 [Plasmodium berghei]SCM16617.1 exported protein 2 [Plasmodium berghei]SCM18414.1 exported protein 2 [Plasmodium berghei]SCN27844.1 exported protein 2 [Plasmodium berghei]|eukprot:XP_034423499.1 exported protein 2 [Plasmodium berghei ANKA]